MSLMSTPVVHAPSPDRDFGRNVRYNGLEWRSTRPVDYKVFIYNASSRTFEKVSKINLTIPGVDENDITTVAVGDPREPWKHADPGTGKPVKTVSGKDNEKWHYVTSFSQPLLMAKPNDQSNMIEHYEQDAIRYVVDLINPDNPTKTLDFAVPDNARFSIGNDLSQKGVFFSLSNPPFQEDVRKAIDRMEKYYKNLLERAATLELTDKAKLAEELGSNPDYAFAADYYGKAVSWRRSPQRTIECPNCGEQKPSGRLFHMASFGAMCVEQSLAAWQSAVRSGVKTYDQVPEDFRWKNEKPSEQSPVTEKLAPNRA